MKRKKFLKLNFDSDDGFHYYDDEITGPLRPGNAFYQWLGRSNIPLHVPMPETLIIGYPPYHTVGNGDGPTIPRPTSATAGTTATTGGGHHHHQHGTSTTLLPDPMTTIPTNVKLLCYDYKKHFLQSFYGHFDSQDLRDKFYDLCYEKFLIHNSLNYLLTMKEEKDLLSKRRAKTKKVESSSSVDGPIVASSSSGGGGMRGTSGTRAGYETATTDDEGGVVSDSDNNNNSNKKKKTASKVRPSSASALYRSKSKLSETATSDTTAPAPMNNNNNKQPCDHKPIDIMDIMPLFNRFVAIQKKPVNAKPPTTGGVNANPNPNQRKYSRTDTHQQCETVLSLAFQTHLLELFDSTINTEEKVANPFILQRWVKSRGKRPSVYRIFWKNGSDMGMAEGYNIAKTEEEFTLPDLVAGKKHSNTLQTKQQSATTESKAQGQGPNQSEVHSPEHEGEGDKEFQKLTSKFIANILLLGQKKKNQELSEQMHKANQSHTTGTTVAGIEVDHTANKTALPPRPKSAGAVPSASSRAIKKLTRFDTASSLGLAGDVSEGEGNQTNNNSNPSNAQKGMAKRTFSSSSNSLQLVNTTNNNASSEAVIDVGKTTEQTKTKILDSLFSKTPQELDDLFLKGLKAQHHLSSAEKTEAMTINTKISQKYLNMITTSISHNNTGELSDEKCDKLMVTRVSNSALATPIHYMAEVARWIQHSLIHLHQVNVQISDLVCDFIKDDNDFWYLINVKGFRITQESIPRVRFWYYTRVLGKSESEANGGKEHQLTSKERHWKHAAELGLQCKLCGVYYVENSFIAMPLTRKLQEVFAEMERENKAKNNQWGNPVKDVPALDARMKQSLGTEDGVEMVPVPVFGYQMTISAATTVAFAYYRHHMTLTRLSQILLESFQQQSNQTRSVKLAMELSSLRESMNNGGDGGVASHLVGDMIACCYYCKEIYERHQLNEKTCRLLYDLLGANHNLLVTQAASVSTSTTTEAVAAENGVLVVDPQLTAKSPMALSMDKRNIFSPPRKHNKNSSIYQTENDGLQALLEEKHKSNSRPQSASSFEGDGMMGGSSAVSVGRPRPVRPKSASALSTTSMTSAFGDVGAGGSHTSVKYGIGPTPAERALEQMIHKLHAAGITNPTEYAQFLQYVVKQSPLESKSYDSSYDMIQRYLLQHRQELSHYLSYHALPRGILFWRLFCLSHCMIIEHNTHSKRGSGGCGGGSAANSPQKTQLHHNQQLPKYFCLSYTLGQSNVYIPFTTECKHDDNAPMKLSIDLSRPMTIVPIKECRIHSVCANKKDLMQFFREKKIVFTLYSDGVEGIEEENAFDGKKYGEEEMKHASVASGSSTSRSANHARDWQNNVIYQQEQGRSQQQQQQRPKSANAVSFREPTSFNSNDGRQSPNIRPGSAKSRQSQQHHHKMVLEGQFIVPLNKLNLADDDVLQEGLTKEDFMIFFQSKSMGKICVKLSLAMVLTPSLPETNPMASVSSAPQSSSGGTDAVVRAQQPQGSFYREFDGIFWPPATFAPSNVSLPHAWMCMLTNHSNNQGKWVEMADLEALHHEHLDSDDEENQLLPLLDEELAKEERMIKEEMQRIKSKQQGNSNMTMSHHHQRSKQNLQIQEAMLVGGTAKENASNAQASLRKSLLRNSIVMDQALLRATGGGNSIQRNNKLDMLVEEEDQRDIAQQPQPLPKISLTTATTRSGRTNAGGSPVSVHRKGALDPSAMSISSSSSVIGNVLPFTSPSKKASSSPPTVPSGLSPSPSVLDVQEDVEGGGTITKSAYDIRKLSNVFIAKNKFKKALNTSKQQKSLLMQSFGNNGTTTDASTTQTVPTPGSSIVGKRSIMINQLYSQLHVVQDLPSEGGEEGNHAPPATVNIFNKLEAEIKEKQRSHQPISLVYHSDGIDVLMNLFEERVDLEEEKELTKRRARHRLNKRSKRQFERYKEKMIRDKLKADRLALEEKDALIVQAKLEAKEKKKRDRHHMAVNRLIARRQAGEDDDEEEDEEDDDEEEEESEEDTDEDEDSNLDDESISSTDSDVKAWKHNLSSSSNALLSKTSSKGQCTFNHNMDALCILLSKPLLEKLLYVVFLVKAKYLHYKEEQAKKAKAEASSSSAQDDDVMTSMRRYSHRGKPIAIDPKRSLLNLQEVTEVDEEDDEEGEGESRGEKRKDSEPSKHKQKNSIVEETEEVKRARRASILAIVGPDANSDEIPKRRAFSSFMITDKTLQETQVRLLRQEEPILEEGNEIKIDEHEWKYLSEELIESMSLALKNLTIFDYLPSHLNWTLLKPLILENLRLFIAEKRL